MKALDVITEKGIREAASLLRTAAPRGSTIMLFGSHARGDARPDSDLDFLVIEPEVHDRHGEMVRLRDALRPLRIPADVLVTSREAFEEWRETPNNVLYEVAQEGLVLDEVG